MSNIILKTEDVISLVGTMTGIFLFIPPSILFYKIIRKQEKHIIISKSMLLFNIVCGELWMCYWLRLNKIIPMISSAISLSFSLIFAIIYLYFYFLGKIINWFFSSIFTIIVVWQCYYYIIFILEDYEIIGMIAMIINIITYIPAAQNISRIIRQGNFKSIPIFNTIIGIFSSICWLTYGILIKNIISIIPNAIGFIISIIHIAIWTFFNLRMKSDDDKNENLSNNEIEDD
jgi:uncharacterized protein with PQ loop repeat